MNADLSVSHSNHLFPWKWKLANGFPSPGIKPNGLKVFGTFVCGGGSAMGYKLAGCDYLGGVEIDKRIGEVYCRNLRPKYFYNEDIRAFLERNEYPEELRDLDILDGSPPCTLFSLNRGKKREESWGKKKKFAEGQEEQTIDDLVFVWTDLVAKLQPKVCLMENVEGLAKGGAKKYLLNIVKRLEDAGYDTQVFILDAQNMGVPQVRRRCFVIGRRKDLHFQRLTMQFNEERICFGELRDRDYEGYLDPMRKAMWRARIDGDTGIGDTTKRERGHATSFSYAYAYDHLPCPTLVTVPHISFSAPRFLSETEIREVATFPLDYDHTGANLVFLTGMCVPPVMSAQIAYQIAKQAFGK